MKRAPSSDPRASQLTLFEAEPLRPVAPLSLDTGFRDSQRTQLDETSWVEHVRGWVSRNELLLEMLETRPTWEQRKRWMFTKLVEEPRLTAEYPVLADAPIPMLQQMAALLSQRYHTPYDKAWLNLYRTHADSTSWHADRLPARLERSVVPVVSLGATRRFLIRHRAGGPSSSFLVHGGDLIVMGGRCQRDWVHCVPKQSRMTGARISVNFGSSSYL